MDSLRRELCIPHAVANDIFIVGGAAQMEKSAETFVHERQTESYDRAREFNAERRKIVEDYLWIGVDNPSEVDLKIQRGASLRRALLNDVTTAAMDHALQTDTSLEEFQFLASAGVTVVDTLQNGLMQYSWDPDLKKRWNFWRHERDPLALVKKEGSPYFERSSIECAASEYLNLPYRSKLLERTLVDVVVAMELYAFLLQMLMSVPWFLRWLPANSQLQQKHVARQYISGQVFSAVVCLGGAWLASNAAWKTASNILVSTFFGSFAFLTIALPFAWRRQTKSRSNVPKIIEAMIRTYAELESNGVVSTRRVREVATKAADTGVVWPGPLFAILDDNITRSGRL
jgi:hypothetical protein